MDNPAEAQPTRSDDGTRDDAREGYRKGFWSKENLKLISHTSGSKAARIVNDITRGRDPNLSMFGCKATLMRLLDKNVHYYGIDITIHNPAPNLLLETDFLETPISFGDRLEIILAQGVFEYLSGLQDQKLQRSASHFLAVMVNSSCSYWNFGHRNKHVYEAFRDLSLLTIFRPTWLAHSI